jgi:hypothetical protein
MSGSTPGTAGGGGGGIGAVGGNFQHAALGKKAAAHTVGGQAHLAERRARHALDAVVPCQAIIEQGEVGFHHIADRPIRADQFGKIRAGLIDHGQLEKAVELGKKALLGTGELDIPQVEPGIGEIGNEPPAVGMPEQAIHLGGQRRGIARQFPGGGGRQQRLVGRGAGEEIRQAGRQLVVVEEIRPLPEVKEIRRAQDGRHRGAQRGLEGGSAREFRLKETQEWRHFFIRHGTAEGFLSDPFQHRGGIGRGIR